MVPRAAGRALRRSPCAAAGHRAGRRGRSSGVRRASARVVALRRVAQLRREPLGHRRRAAAARRDDLRRWHDGRRPPDRVGAHVRPGTGLLHGGRPHGRVVVGSALARSRRERDRLGAHGAAEHGRHEHGWWNERGRWAERRVVERPGWIGHRGRCRDDDRGGYHERRGDVGLELRCRLGRRRRRRLRLSGRIGSRQRAAAARPASPSTTATLSGRRAARAGARAALRFSAGSAAAATPGTAARRRR